MAAGRPLDRDRGLEVEPAVAGQLRGLVEQAVHGLGAEPRPRRPAPHRGGDPGAGRLAVDHGAQLVQVGVDPAHEGRGDDARADVVQGFTELGRDGDGERLGVGHGVAQDRPHVALGHPHPRSSRCAMAATGCPPI